MSVVVHSGCTLLFISCKFSFIHPGHFPSNQKLLAAQTEKIWQSISLYKFWISKFHQVWGKLWTAARHFSSWICALYICIIDCEKRVNTNKVGNTFVIIFVFLIYATLLQTAGSKSGNVIMKSVCKSDKGVYAKIRYFKTENMECSESALNQAKHGSLPYLECVMSFP